MRRFKITIEYDGTSYYGWQRQKDHVSVQQAIEEALAKLTHETIKIEGAGRTDAGVHALGQVAHFDVVRDITAYRMKEGLNFHLNDHGISIVNCENVEDDFHARFSAVSRSYCYRIFNRRSPSPLEANRSWHIKKPLDLDAMLEGCQYFLGHHDFSSFRAAACQAKSAEKTLTHLSIQREGDHVISVRIASPSFLHNQVRIIMGTLVQVGLGKREARSIESLLKTPDRKRSGMTAPPYGLYFDSITY